MDTNELDDEKGNMYIHVLALEAQNNAGINSRANPQNVLVCCLMTKRMLGG